MGLHYEVFSSVNARPRLEDLCSSGNALPKKVEQVGKGKKNSGDIYGSEVWGPGMSLAVRISLRNGTFLITTDASYLLRSKIRTLQHCCHPSTFKCSLCASSGPRRRKGYRTACENTSDILSELQIASTPSPATQPQFLGTLRLYVTSSGICDWVRISGRSIHPSQCFLFFLITFTVNIFIIINHIDS